MATYDVLTSGKSLVGPRNASTAIVPYLQVAVVDFSKLNGSTGLAAADLVRCMYLPQKSHIEYIIAEVVSKPTTVSGSATVSISANAITYISGKTITTTNGMLELDGAVVSNGVVTQSIFTTNNNVIVTLAVKAAGSNVTDGVINVYAWVKPNSNNSTSYA